MRLLFASCDGSHPPDDSMKRELHWVGKPGGDVASETTSASLSSTLVDNVSLYQVCSEEHALGARKVRGSQERVPVHFRAPRDVREDAQIGVAALGWPRLLRWLT